MKSKNSLTVLVFTSAIFLSAALLFVIQPIFAKMVLPLLGGAPAVWTTAMVFFQVVLLAGYAYAHIVGNMNNGTTKRAIHLLLAASAILFLPIAINSDWSSPDTQSPLVWLLTLFTVSIGLPFFALSANAPLIQRWFSETDHPQANDPYFLYAASNVGSIAALLAYPIFIEPAIGLKQQSLIWSVGYFSLLLILVVCCTVRSGKRPIVHTNIALRTKSEKISPSAIQRVSWLLFALVPSSLLLGVTTHLSTDVAAVPMVWIIPLVLFLLTFVNVFSNRPLISHQIAVRVHGLTIVALLGIYPFDGFLPAAATFAIHLLAFFFSALVCHGELARRRPDSSNLTEFYLWMSLGGALGGVFNGIIAPLIFTSITEYPLAIVAACALRPILAEGKKARGLNDFLLPLLLTTFCFAVLLLLSKIGISGKPQFAVIALFILSSTLTVYSFSIRPIRFALGVAVLMVSSSLILEQGRDIAHRERSFFGTHTVIFDEKIQSVILKHGTTVHGLQKIGALYDSEPLSYYSKTGPVGQVFDALRKRNTPISAAIVGLGAGALICYKQQDEFWKVFEIDPAVLRIASNPEYFRYLRSCGSNTQFILGDARLSLEQERNSDFNIVLLDAFSSDSIPVNIVTQEALELYFDVLSNDGGLLLAHISNRYLDLESVFDAHANTMNLSARTQRHIPENLGDEFVGVVSPSHWLLLAQSESIINDLNLTSDWQPLHANRRTKPWTDDFSNILDVFDWSPATE